jgi:hypothetical protein
VWSALNGDELHNFEHKRIVRSADFAPVRASRRAHNDMTRHDARACVCVHSLTSGPVFLFV